MSHLQDTPDVSGVDTELECRRQALVARLQRAATLRQVAIEFYTIFYFILIDMFNPKYYLLRVFEQSLLPQRQYLLIDKCKIMPHQCSSYYTYVHVVFAGSAR